MIVAAQTAAPPAPVAAPPPPTPSTTSATASTIRCTLRSPEAGVQEEKRTGPTATTAATTEYQNRRYGRRIGRYQKRSSQIHGGEIPGRNPVTKEQTRFRPDQPVRHHRTSSPPEVSKLEHLRLT